VDDHVIETVADKNSLSVMPTGVQGVYPGSSNFAPPPSEPVDETPSSTMPEGSKGDVVEGAPGIIESTELAPLGEGKVADDRRFTISSKY
jgi:hypothetical protein